MLYATRNPESHCKENRNLVQEALQIRSCQAITFTDVELGHEKRLNDIITRQECDWKEMSRYVGGANTAAECQRQWNVMLASEEFDAPRAPNGMLEILQNGQTRQEDTILWKARRRNASFVDIIEKLPFRHHIDSSQLIRHRYIKLARGTRNLTTKWRAREMDHLESEALECSEESAAPEVLSGPNKQ